MSTILTVVLALGGFVTGLSLAVVRGLLGNELQGRIERRITANVEATISSLPLELQLEWAEEWRAELSALIGMPLSAAAFARNLRDSASQLVSEPALAPAPTGERSAPQRRGGRPPQQRSFGKRVLRLLATARRSIDRRRDQRFANLAAWLKHLSQEFDYRVTYTREWIGFVRHELERPTKLLARLAAITGALAGLLRLAGLI